MDTNTCIYCGSSDIIPVDEEHYLEQNLHILQCRQCRVMFTELEQRLDSVKTLLDYKPNFDINDEETVLDAVLKMMQDDRIYSALELLFQHSCPLQHTAEFIICRDLWQISNALLTYGVLGETKNYDHFSACRMLFSSLINNLQRIDFSFPSYTEEQRLRAMRRLCDFTLLTLGAFIRVGALELRQQDSFTDFVLQQRLTAITFLAEKTENMHSPGQSPDYLKIAGRLWNECLKSVLVCRENLSSRDPNFGKYIAPPEALQKQICAKIDKINATVSKYDLGFKISKPNNWFKHHIYLCSFGFVILLNFLIIALIALCSEFDIIAKLFGSDNNFFNFLESFALPMGIIIVVAAIIFGAVYSIKYTRKLKKEKAKRKQLHDIVFQQPNKQS